MSDALFARFGREYQAGEALFGEGEPGDVMYVIQSGAVRISKQIGGEERVVAVVGAGELVGEMAILNSRPRSATATALEPTRCVLVRADRLGQMVTGSAEIAVRLIRKLAQRLEAADALLEVLLHRDPKARMMLAIARHAERAAPDDAGAVRVRMSFAEIARSVDVSGEAVDEVAGRLRRLRLVKEVPEGILVEDLGRLREFIEFLEAPHPLGGES